MEHKMIHDILSPPTQRSITTLRTLLRTTVLSTGCTLCAISFSFGAELFPFAAPSAYQQRSVEQHSRQGLSFATCFVALLFWGKHPLRQGYTTANSSR